MDFSNLKMDKMVFRSFCPPICSKNENTQEKTFENLHDKGKQIRASAVSSNFSGSFSPFAKANRTNCKRVK